MLSYHLCVMKTTYMQICFFFGCELVSCRIWTASTRWVIPQHQSGQNSAQKVCLLLYLVAKLPQNACPINLFRSGKKFVTLCMSFISSNNSSTGILYNRFLQLTLFPFPLFPSHPLQIFILTGLLKTKIVLTCSFLK